MYITHFQVNSSCPYALQPHRRFLYKATTVVFWTRRTRTQDVISHFEHRSTISHLKAAYTFPLHDLHAIMSSYLFKHSPVGTIIRYATKGNLSYTRTSSKAISESSSTDNVSTTISDNATIGAELMQEKTSLVDWRFVSSSQVQQELCAD